MPSGQSDCRSPKPESVDRDCAGAPACPQGTCPAERARARHPTATTPSGSQRGETGVEPELPTNSPQTRDRGGHLGAPEVPENR